jgi:hypothetical protein
MRAQILEKTPAKESASYTITVLENRLGSNGPHNRTWERFRLSRMFVPGAQNDAKVQTHIEVDPGYFFQCRATISVWSARDLAWQVVYRATSDDLAPLIDTTSSSSLAIQRAHAQANLRLNMVEKQLLDYAFNVIFG